MSTQLEQSHVDLYARLGNWKQACYGAPLGVAPTSRGANGPVTATVKLDAAEVPVPIGILPRICGSAVVTECESQIYFL